MNSFIFNAVGLVLNILGAGLMFWGSGMVDSKLILYSKEDQPKIKKQDRVRNIRIRLGMAFLFIGFIAQFIALFF